MSFQDILNKHAKIVNINGVSEKDEMTTYIEYDFEQMLTFSPNSESVVIDGVSTKCIVQLGKDNKKDVLVRNSDSFKSGSIIEWNSTYWLTYYYEDKAIQGYQKGRIARCITILKFKDISGTIIEEPLVYDDLSKYSMGVNEEKRILLTDSSKVIFIQHNSYTTKLYRDFRFIIDSKVYKMTDIDELDTEGLLKIKCVEVEASIYDDFDNFVANNEISEIISVSDLKLTGDDEVNKGYSEVYNVEKYDEFGDLVTSSFTFTTVELDTTPSSSYDLTVVDGNNCSILCNEFMDDDYNLYSIKLVATDDSDGSNIIEKTIKFKGLY